MMTNCTFFVCFAIFAFGASSVLGQSAQEQSKLAKLFGQPVQIKDQIYEYNDDYAIRLSFERTTDTLTKFEVAPKYFFRESNPDWSEEPDFDVGLTRQDYDAILGKLSQFFSIGNLNATSTIAVVTNLKAKLIDIYDKAVVERSQRRANGRAVYSATVWLVRDISGAVEDRTRIEISPSFVMWKVKMRGCWYWTRNEERIQAEPASLRVAGPTNHPCE